MDGVASITTAVDSAYLQQLRDRGMPIALSSCQMADFVAPVAMPDNHGGTNGQGFRFASALTGDRVPSVLGRPLHDERADLELLVAHQRGR